MAGSNTKEGSADVGRLEAPRAHSRLVRGLGWSTTALVFGIPLALLAGFLWFIARLPGDAEAPLRKVDGIVVLTGGASRISDAIELLAAGHGRRLLISGVNRATSAREIARINPELERWVRCCVDFDHSLNTMGNAVETRLWSERRGFHSLIVVTSDYHMPRAMAEIAHQLPDAILVPYPVVSDRLRTEPWWSSSAIARLLLSEYMKYIFAQVRIRLNPAHEPA